MDRLAPQMAIHRAAYGEGGAAAWASADALRDDDRDGSASPMDAAANPSGAAAVKPAPALHSRNTDPRPTGRNTRTHPPITDRPGFRAVAMSVFNAAPICKPIGPPRGIVQLPATRASGTSS